MVFPEPSRENVRRSWRAVKGGITVGALKVPSFALPDFPVDVLEDLT